MTWIAWVYKQLWSRIGGRPWTYIMRDFAYQNPLLMLLIGLNVGFYLGSILVADLVHVGVFFSGLLAGHLFWGTKWQKGERC